MTICIISVACGGKSSRKHENYNRNECQRDNGAYALCLSVCCSVASSLIVVMVANRDYFAGLSCPTGFIAAKTAEL